MNAKWLCVAKAVSLLACGTAWAAEPFMEKADLFEAGKGEGSK